MQFTFAARRGRRVFQRLNKLQQTATLSTRVPVAASHVQRAFRTAENRASPLIKGGSYTLGRFTTVQKYNYSAAATDTPRKAPKKSEGSKKTTKAKKPKAKKKSTAKKPTKTKKELTPEQLEKKKAGRKNAKLSKEIQDLKIQSLRSEEPKTHTLAPWVLFVAEKVRGSPGVDETRSRFRTAAQEFRNLSTYERQELERQAADRKQEQDRVYAQWINSHTPLQIKTANNARKRLELLTAEHRKRTVKYPAIKDDRLVKPPTGSYIYFTIERSQDGALSTLSFKEKSARLISEWGALSEQEKQSYVDKAAEDKERYAKEYRDVYGEEPYFLSKGKSKAASST